MQGWHELSVRDRWGKGVWGLIIGIFFLFLCTVAHDLAVAVVRTSPTLAATAALVGSTVIGWFTKGWLDDHL